MTARKRYDAEYFRRWYHDPRRRVIVPSAVARKVRLVVGIAEALLERPIRSVLDVGAGEGAWRGHLRRLRPRVRYVGVESSEYAVERFGRARGLVRGPIRWLRGLIQRDQDMVERGRADTLELLPGMLDGLLRVRRS